MPKPLSTRLEENLDDLQGMFGSSMDLYTKRLSIQGVACAACMFDGLSSTEKLWVILLDAMSRPEEKAQNGWQLYQRILHQSDIPAESGEVADLDELVRRMTAGMTVLLIDGSCKAIALSTQNMQARSVQEPSGEGNIRGSREGFTDLLRVNVSLLRRLIRTDSLAIELLTLGERTATEVVLCYDKTLASPALVAMVRKKLQHARLPLLLDSGYLAPFLHGSGAGLFSEVGYTERPATACAKLCEGKVVILVNGSPFAMILPYFFTEHFQSLDDYASKAYFCSFIRLLKYLAFALAVGLPGGFVCAVQYTPELLPPQLLYKIAAAERATPWPLFLEMVLVILLLEIIREAGLRLPKPIGHSVSLVAALIVGDAAVGAGILSTPVLIIAALTSICTFVLPSLYEPVTVLRILFVFAGGMLGPAGVVALFVVMLLSICGMESFGLPYTSPLAPFGWGSVRDGILRAPWKSLARTPFTIDDLPGGEDADD